MEIVGKFGAAMSGFWWALDDHERRMLLFGAAWVLIVAVELASAQSARRNRRALVDELAAEVGARLAADA